MQAKRPLERPTVDSKGSGTSGVQNCEDGEGQKRRKIDSDFRLASELSRIPSVEPFCTYTNLGDAGKKPSSGEGNKHPLTTVNILGVVLSYAEPRKTNGSGTFL